MRKTSIVVVALTRSDLKAQEETARLIGLQFSLPALALGLIVGTTYGLLAVGLVLIYRSTQTINLAHGSIGVFALAVPGLLSLHTRLPYYLNFVLILCAGGLIGAAVQVTVIERLKRAPQIV